jgi:hypothetical protein
MTTAFARWWRRQRAHGDPRRVGAVTGHVGPTTPGTGLWTRRNTNSGRFTEIKKSGGAFKGRKRS